MKNWKAYFLANSAAFLSLSAIAHASETKATVAADTQLATVAPGESMSAEPTESMEQRAQVETDRAQQQAERMKKDIAKAATWVEEFLGINRLAPIEADRLIAARLVANSVMQKNSVERMVNNLYGRLLNLASDDMGRLNSRQLSRLFGMDREQAELVSKDDLHRISLIINPQLADQQARMNAALRPVVDEAMAVLVPAMHEGISRAYARRFSVAELHDVSAFFATPAGAAFASEVLPMQADPELIIAMVRSGPELVDRLNVLRPQIDEFFKDFGPTPNSQNSDALSDAQMRQIAKILKMDVKVLKAHLAEKSAADLADKAEMAELASQMEAYDRANWSPEWRARVEALETAAQAAKSQVSEAENKAIEEAGSRLAGNRKGRSNTPK